MNIDPCLVSSPALVSKGPDHLEVYVGDHGPGLDASGLVYLYV